MGAGCSNMHRPHLSILLVTPGARVTSPTQVVRDVLGLDTRDTSDTRDHAAGTGSALGKNYLGNDFLNINRMKIDVCTKEIFHNTIII